MVKIEPLKVDIEVEEDGKFLASVPALPGVMAYGETKESALRKAKAIALQVLADMIESGDEAPQPPAPPMNLMPHTRMHQPDFLGGSYSRAVRTQSAGPHYVDDHLGGFGNSAGRVAAQAAGERQHLNALVPGVTEGPRIAVIHRNDSWSVAPEHPLAGLNPGRVGPGGKFSAGLHVRSYRRGERSGTSSSLAISVRIMALTDCTSPDAATAATESSAGGSQIWRIESRSACEYLALIS